MASKGKLASLNKALAAANAKAPQEGFFSTLDELIQEAPFETGAPEQWKGFLKPGRALVREDVSFPLKKEELDFTGFEDILAKALNDGKATKSEILKLLRSERPTIEAFVSVEPKSRGAGASNRYDDQAKRRRDLINEGKVPFTGYSPDSGTDQYYNQRRLAHLDTRVPGSYEESITRSPEFGEYPSHFSNEDISWSRTTRQPVADNPEKTARLIEEIQSDRHSAAAEKWTSLDAESQRLMGDLFELMKPHHQRNRRASGFPKFYPDRQHELRKVALLVEPETGILKDDPIAVDAVTRLSQLAKRRGYGSGYHEAWREWQAENGADVPSDLDSELVFQQATGRTPNGLEPIPNTPFKNPEDYARLEMKKQMMNAAEEGDSYLTVSTPQHQIERYDLMPDSREAKGMEEMYGQKYQSELEKLANQYGIGMTDAELQLSPKVKDWRPESMREMEFETIDDYIEGLEDMYGTMPNAEVDPAGSVEWYQRMQDEYWDIGQALISRVRDAKARGFDRSNADYYLQALNSDFATFRKTGDPSHYKGLLREIDDMISDFDMETQSSQAPTKMRAQNLTPEIREKLNRIGVPLWAAAGATSLTQLMGDEEPEGYGEGGKVRSARRALELLAKNRSEGLTPNEKRQFTQLANAETKRTGVELVDYYEDLHRQLDQADAESAKIPKVQKHAEGGKVEEPSKGPKTRVRSTVSQKALRMLRDTAMSLGAERAAENRQRLAFGLSTQLFGLDQDEKKPTLNYRPTAKVGSSKKLPIGLELFPGFQVGFDKVPGIVDSALALPAMPAQFASAFTGENYRGPEFAEQAQGRIDQLDGLLRSEYNLREPETPKDVFNESLGMMLGQIPIPGGVGAKAGRFAAEAIETGKKGALSALEWFSPTVVPRLENYLSGAAFPAALSTETGGQIIQKIAEQVQQESDDEEE